MLFGCETDITHKEIGSNTKEHDAESTIDTLNFNLRQTVKDVEDLLTYYFHSLKENIYQK